jgi:squalene-associated FAD-dependent desaturase
MEPGVPVKVVIIGAGVAGLAAAVALARDGASVTLLERRPFVGGRAYSYPHPALDETIDSQHVILGCCTNFIDLLTQSGAADTIRWYDELTFLEPQVRPTSNPWHSDPEQSEGEEPPHLDLRPAPDLCHSERSEEPPHFNLSAAAKLPPTCTILYPTSLPAPFHQSLAFLRAPMLTLRDKAAVALGLAHFLRGYPTTDEESFATWLKRTRQTERAIRHFWEPVIVGALNDSFANCSTRYAGKVFHESFLRSPQAGRLGIPTAPLSEFFAPVAAYARTLGVDLRLNSSVTALTPLPGNHWRITSGPEEIEADAIILATNLRQTQDLLTALAAAAPSANPADDGCPIHAASSHGWGPAPETSGTPVPFDRFTTAPITTIHLWYDREITSLDHAVLLDTRIQWMFNKSRIRRWQPSRGTYLELVISASFAELALPREQILASALSELELFFPQVASAKLLKSAVLKEAGATFSVTPGLDAHRPPQTTAYPNLFLAGDWTATDWPSTMEGAIRGGRLAAGTLIGSPTRFLSPELPATGLMRWLTRTP